MLVAGIALADPGKTLQQIGAQLEAMHQRAPRGGVRWSPSSVKSLLDRAVRRGLIPAAEAQADDRGIALAGKFIRNPINDTD